MNKSAIATILAAAALSVAKKIYGSKAIIEISTIKKETYHSRLTIEYYTNEVFNENIHMPIIVDTIKNAIEQTSYEFNMEIEAPRIILEHNGEYHVISTHSAVNLMPSNSNDTRMHEMYNEEWPGDEEVIEDVVASIQDKVVEQIAQILPEIDLDVEWANYDAPEFESRITPIIQQDKNVNRLRKI